MSDLTIEDINQMSDGVMFRRSDGALFFMRQNDDGSVTLFAAIIGFDVNVADKVAAAQPHIIAYKKARGSAPLA
jgi:hypothetical protein